MLENSTIRFCCPRCRSVLDYESSSILNCTRCSNTYPVINRELPILVEDPAAYVTGEQHFMKHDADQLVQASQMYLQASEDHCVRSEILKKIGEALNQNADLIHQISSILPDIQTNISEHGIALGADLFPSLRKDWSGLDECEQELNLIFQVIDQYLRDLQPEKILVLGAGTGRMLCEIDERYGGTCGIDLSALMSGAYLNLSTHGYLDSFLLQQGNFLKSSEECELIQAKRDLAAGKPQYAIADASSLPFPDDCFDAIVSHYFTDMLPLSMWLNEVKRVLKTDGRFIHYGPLGYAFPQITEHFAVDQLPMAFEKHGLKMSEPRYVRSSFYGNLNRLNRFEFDNLVFYATHL